MNRSGNRRDWFKFRHQTCPLRRNACSGASSTKSVCMKRLTCQLTMRQADGRGRQGDQRRQSPRLRIRQAHVSPPHRSPHHQIRICEMRSATTVAWWCAMRIIPRTSSVSSSSLASSSNSIYEMGSMQYADQRPRLPPDPMPPPGPMPPPLAGGSFGKVTP